MEPKILIAHPWVFSRQERQAANLLLQPAIETRGCRCADYKETCASNHFCSGNTTPSTRLRGASHFYKYK